MTTPIRWAKYSAIGTIGSAIQLALLALFNREAPGHYSGASLAAVEIALLHNFVWHSRYTWRDRRDSGTRFGQLLRFHFSNGAVSIMGNLVLMRLLVEKAHLPVVESNAVTIVCCAGFNFLLANYWAFRAGNVLTQRSPRAVF